MTVDEKCISWPWSTSWRTTGSRNRQRKPLKRWNTVRTWTVSPRWNPTNTGAAFSISWQRSSNEMANARSPMMSVPTFFLIVDYIYHLRVSLIQIFFFPFFCCVVLVSLVCSLLHPHRRSLFFFFFCCCLFVCLVFSSNLLFTFCETTYSVMCGAIKKKDCQLI